MQVPPNEAKYSRCSLALTWERVTDHYRKCEKGDSEESPWRAPFLLTKLEDVAKLDLADATTSDTAHHESFAGLSK